MNHGRSRIANSPNTILNYMEEIFGSSVRIPTNISTHQWFMDQKMISIRLTEWMMRFNIIILLSIIYIARKKCKKIRKNSKNPKKLDKKNPKSPKEEKSEFFSEKSKNLQKNPFNTDFFSFSDLNLRTLKRRVINPHYILHKIIIYK